VASFLFPLSFTQSFDTSFPLFFQMKGACPAAEVFPVVCWVEAVPEVLRVPFRGLLISAFLVGRGCSFLPSLFLILAPHFFFAEASRAIRTSQYIPPAGAIRGLFLFPPLSLRISVTLKIFVRPYLA